ncbi:MAG: hypothetical protein AB8B83_00565 [Bdellovibrionales bacterium]
MTTPERQLVDTMLNISDDVNDAILAIKFADAHGKQTYKTTITSAIIGLVNLPPTFLAGAGITSTDATTLMIAGITSAIVAQGYFKVRMKQIHESFSKSAEKLPDNYRLYFKRAEYRLEKDRYKGPMSMLDFCDLFSEELGNGNASTVTALATTGFFAPSLSGSVIGTRNYLKALFTANEFVEAREKLVKDMAEQLSDSSEIFLQTIETMARQPEA